jgi:hypothetical protein
MKSRQLAIVVLGAAALLLAFVSGQAAQSQTVPEASTVAFPCGRQLAYITAWAPAGGTLVSVPNPRAASGEVFYITDIITKDDGTVQIHFPPELGDPSLGLVLLGRYDWHDPDIMLDEHRVSYQRPIPLVTTIDAYLGSSPEAHCVTFVGYYSPIQPDITVVDGG